MAMTHTEWQYGAQYARHVRPKLPTDESDPSKSAYLFHIRQV